MFQLKFQLRQVNTILWSRFKCSLLECFRHTVSSWVASQDSSQIILLAEFLNFSSWLFRSQLLSSSLPVFPLVLIDGPFIWALLRIELCLLVYRYIGYTFLYLFTYSGNGSDQQETSQCGSQKCINRPTWAKLVLQKCLVQVLQCKRSHNQEFCLCPLSMALNANLLSYAHMEPKVLRGTWNTNKWY